MYLINVFLGSDDSQRVRVLNSELKRGHGLGLVQGNADVTPSEIEIHFVNIFFIPDIIICFYFEQFSPFSRTTWASGMDFIALAKVS